MGIVKNCASQSAKNGWAGSGIGEIAGGLNGSISASVVGDEDFNAAMRER